MYSWGVLHHHLQEEARRQHGTHGMFFLRSQQHLKTYYTCKKILDVQLFQLCNLVVLMYDRTSDILEVNKARKHLFTRKSRSLENLPPTLTALEQDIKRVCYQSNSWNQTLIHTFIFKCKIITPYRISLVRMRPLLHCALEYNTTNASRPT